jgi:PIN domain nuclease of toxin-antitoxin system
MNSVLLDTHVLIWLLVGNKKIGNKSSNLIIKALQAEKLYISSVSMWEVAMLVERGRIKLLQPIHHWYRDILSFGIKEIPLFGDIAIESVLLEGFHSDPADRMIVATAIGKGFTLLTADSKILEWAGALERLNVEE